MRAAASLALLFAFATACGATPAPRSALPGHPVAKRGASRALAGTFWEGEPLDLRPSSTAAEPLTAERLEREGGAQARWDEAPEPLRSTILRAGFAVVPRSQGTGSLGAYYQSLQDTHTPALLTVDALFCAVHAALEAALAELDRTVLAALKTLVVKLDDRLGTEDRGVKPDWIAATARAQGIVAVARTLLDPMYVTTGAVASRVKAELDRVAAHLGIEQSSVLDRPIDYSVFDAAGGFADADERLGAFRAATWLAEASLELGTRSPEAHVVLPVERMRDDARAALLFARLLRSDSEVATARAWERIDDTTTFVFGANDDLTPRELAKVAANAGVDVRNTAALQNVTLIDKVRRAAVEQSPAARIWSGVPVVERMAGRPLGTVSVRVLGLTAPTDGRALQALVTPLVGPDPNGKVRVLPSALDVGAWLGSSEALAALREAGVLRFEGYSKALGDVVSRGVSASDPASAHSSVYASVLEAISVYLEPSAGDASGAFVTSEWSRRKLDTALAAWATLRHDATPFAHTPARAATDDALVRVDVPWAVEPHPEAIGRLLSLVRQMEKGLVAHRVLQAAPARALLEEVEALLVAALAGAVAEVNGEPPVASTEAVLGDIAGVFARIEAHAAGPVAAPIVADVHTDLRSGAVLEVGTTGIGELWAAVTDPHTRKIALFAGPHIGHAELSASPRMNDRAWRTRLASQPIARPAFTRGHMVVVPPKPASP